MDRMAFGEAFKILYSKGLFLLGYAKEEIHLMPPLDEPIPEGAKLLVIKSAK